MHAEPIRLVIWDLDNTFWDGTLSEGGIRYRPDHHAIVVELARRGIVSSICSKNAPDAVAATLRQHGIWDSFIFPSISWAPKGPRLAALVEAVQLRPETVLLIDDNAMNRAEAKHFVPGIQVADETTIACMLDNPLLRGKDDRHLSRLTQYKLLERRAADATAAGGDISEFLRASNIRVSIEHDVDAHIDRAVELINRTNQLNFTRNRLPEDPAQAREKLRALLSTYNVQAGIIRVRDRYGDYGYCGLYVLRTGARMHRLLHFCFSCRVLNMGVESWIYHHLGEPLIGQDRELPGGTPAPGDWITLERPGLADGATTTAPALDFLYARGGCDLHAVTHYFEIMTRAVHRDVNTARDGASLRLDHSIFVRHAQSGVKLAAMPALRAIGYQDSDFTAAIDACDMKGSGVWLLSFWADAEFALYEHTATGVKVPLALVGAQPVLRDMTLADPSSLAILQDAARVRALQHDFTYRGMISQAEFKGNFALLMERRNGDTPVFIILGNEAMGNALGDGDDEDDYDDAYGAAPGGGSAPVAATRPPMGGADKAACRADMAARLDDEQTALMVLEDQAAGRALLGPPGSLLGGDRDTAALGTPYGGLYERITHAARGTWGASFPAVTAPKMKPRPRPRMRKINRWLREIAGQYANVTLLDIRHFVHDPAEVISRDHLDRVVYFRIFQHVIGALRRGQRTLAGG